MPPLHPRGRERGGEVRFRHVLRRVILQLALRTLDCIVEKLPAKRVHAASQHGHDLSHALAGKAAGNVPG
jgi:hypothetical protein